MSDQANAVAPEEAMLNFLGADEEEQEIEQAEQAESEEVTEESEEVEEAAPEPEFIELVHDGKQIKKTKDEVITLAQQGFDYTQKTQQLAAEKREVQAQIQAAQQQVQLQNALIEHIAEAKSIEGQLAQYKNVDWNALIAQDQVYAMQLDRQYRELQQSYQGKVSEISQLSQQAVAQTEQRKREMIGNEHQALIRAIPDWADGEKSRAESAEIKDFLTKAGFTDEDVASVYDHRQVVIARKAMLYDKLIASKPEISKRVAEAPKPVKPGSAQQRNPKGEAYAKARETLKKTGRSDDAAAALVRLL